MPLFPLELWDGRLVIAGLGVGPLRAGHSLFGHENTSSAVSSMARQQKNMCKEKEKRPSPGAERGPERQICRHKV